MLPDARYATKRPDETEFAFKQPSGGAFVGEVLPSIGDAHNDMMAALADVWPEGQVGMTLGSTVAFEPIKYENTMEPGEEEHTKRNTLHIGRKRFATCHRLLPGFTEMLAAADKLIKNKVQGTRLRVHDIHLLRQPPVGSGAGWRHHRDAHASGLLATLLVKLNRDDGGAVNGSHGMRSSLTIVEGPGGAPVSKRVDFPSEGGSYVLMRSMDMHHSNPTPHGIGTPYKLVFFFSLDNSAPTDENVPLAASCVLPGLRRSVSSLGPTANSGLFTGVEELPKHTCLGVYTGTHVAQSVLATEKKVELYFVEGVPGGAVTVRGDPAVDLMASANEPCAKSRANTWLEHAVVDHPQDQDRYLPVLITSRQLGPSEEVTVSYGPGYAKVRSKCNYEAGESPPQSSRPSGADIEQSFSRFLEAVGENREAMARAYGCVAFVEEDDGAPLGKGRSRRAQFAGNALARRMEPIHGSVRHVL